MIEKLIKYQNDSEREFEKKKNPATIINYILALIIFFSSTMISAFTFPFRFMYRKITHKKSDSEIIQLDNNNIDYVLKKENLVLIDFWAEWCGPCLMMNSTLDKFAKQSKNIKIAKVNADLNRELINRFQVRGLPQFILLKNGIEVKRYAGAMTLNGIKQFCNEAV